MIMCLSGRAAEIANVSCFKHKINSRSGLVNMVVGLREFLKHYGESWNKISWNCFVILVLGWDEHLSFEQISATQSQGYRPMLISTGLSGNEAYSPLNFLYTWNWSPLKPNTLKCIYFNENYSKIKWTMKFCENELLYNHCIIILYMLIIAV